MADQAYTDYIAKGTRPLPGQSLTRDPDSPAPYEKAPEFSSVHKAIEYLFINVVEEKTYIPLMQAVSNRTPVMDLVQVVLFDGFQRGKWNPDLMIMLAEPLAYIILALAERADIEAVIYRGEEEDALDEETVFGVELDSKRAEGLRKAALSGKVPAGAVPQEIINKIQELPEIPAESLLAAPSAPQVTPQATSLMAPPATQQA
tara:strand:- start:2608 stop:3216 length:609 start_codon:yes stop_codon:yes gene_type:complete